jgi:hypothetical protein
MANKIINSLVHLIHFVLVAATFSLILVSYIKISNTEYKYIQTIGQNWNQGPILSISATLGSCPVGENQLLTGAWPGTVEGCDCSNLTFNLFGSPLKRGSCSSLQNKNKSKRDSFFEFSYRRCIDIRATPAIPYKSWSGRTICAKRVPQSYLDLIVVSSANKCPIDTKPCGKVDSIENVLCVSNLTNCPVNKILFLESKDPIPTDFKYTVVPLGDNKKILYTNENVKGEIVQEFKLSEGQPCLDPTYENINSDQYLLSRVLDKHGCPQSGGNAEMFDIRYSKIDSDDLYSFYSNNGVEDTLMRLPQYKKTSPFSFIDLYVREYFGLTDECRAKIFSSNEGPGGLIKTLLYFEQNVGSIVGWLLAALITVIIGITLEICIPCCVCWNDGNKLNKLPVFMIVFYFIISALLIVFNSVAYSKSSSLPSNYTQLRGQCSDIETNFIIEKFINNFGIGVQLITYSLFLVITTVLFNFIYIIFGVIEKNEEN